jgi:hypothetical protein
MAQLGGPSPGIPSSWEPLHHDFHGTIDGGHQVHRSVVLEVPAALDIQQPHGLGPKGVRAPVPGTPVEHEAIERTQKEHPDVVEMFPVREIRRRRGDGQDRIHIERHQRLGVGVVTVEAVAPGGPGIGVLDLVVGVADHVEVRVGPRVGKGARAVGGVRVGHRQPAERGERIRGQGPRPPRHHSHRFKT